MSRDCIYASFIFYTTLFSYQFPPASDFSISRRYSTFVRNCCKVCYGAVIAGKSLFRLSHAPAMERQMPEQNIPRPKLKKKQGVGVDSISDDQKLRAMNPHINTKSSSSSQLPRYLPPNVIENVTSFIETLLVRLSFFTFFC